LSRASLAAMLSSRWRSYSDAASAMVAVVASGRDDEFGRDGREGRHVAIGSELMTTVTLEAQIRSYRPVNACCTGCRESDASKGFKLYCNKPYSRARVAANKGTKGGSRKRKLNTPIVVRSSYNDVAAAQQPRAAYCAFIPMPLLRSYDLISASDQAGSVRP
jgi:hypothetical protein